MAQSQGQGYTKMKMGALLEEVFSLTGKRRNCYLHTHTHTRTHHIPHAHMRAHTQCNTECDPGCNRHKRSTVRFRWRVEWGKGLIFSKRLPQARNQAKSLIYTFSFKPQIIQQDPGFFVLHFGLQTQKPTFSKQSSALQLPSGEMGFKFRSVWRGTKCFLKLWDQDRLHKEAGFPDFSLL